MWSMLLRGRERRVYIGSWIAILRLDAAMGAERWRFKTGEDPRFTTRLGFNLRRR